MDGKHVHPERVPDQHHDRRGAANGEQVVDIWIYICSSLFNLAGSAISRLCIAQCNEVIFIFLSFRIIRVLFLSFRATEVYNKWLSTFSLKENKSNIALYGLAYQ